MDIKQDAKTPSKQIVFSVSFRKETLPFIDRLISDFKLKRTSGYETLVLGIYALLEQEKIDTEFVKELISEGLKTRKQIVPKRDSVQSPDTLIQSLTPEQLKEMIEKYHPGILNK